jgi:hypothetical protein
LIIVIFCSGIDAHSNLVSQRYYIEHSPDTNKIEDIITPDLDSSDEDQMDQDHRFGLTEQPECQKSYICTLSLPNYLLVSVWRPPKAFRK